MSEFFLEQTLHCALNSLFLVFKIPKSCSDLISSHPVHCFWPDSFNILLTLTYLCDDFIFELFFIPEFFFLYLESQSLQLDFNFFAFTLTKEKQLTDLVQSYHRKMRTGVNIIRNTCYVFQNDKIQRHDNDKCNNHFYQTRLFIV